MHPTIRFAMAAALAVFMPWVSYAADVSRTAPVSPGQALVADNPNETEPDVTQARATEYACDLNDKVIIYEFDGQADHIALRWRDRLHRMTRVVSKSGAQRFEDRNWRLTWIGIPAKGMLLDSRAQRQLANECRNAVQRAAAAQSSAAGQGGLGLGDH